MNLSLEDLDGFGRARMQDDFEACDRRDKHGSLADFAEGWMAAMVRIKQWSYFTTEAAERLRGAA